MCCIAGHITINRKTKRSAGQALPPPPPAAVRTERSPHPSFLPQVKPSSAALCAKRVRRWARRSAPCPQVGRQTWRSAQTLARQGRSLVGPWAVLALLRCHTTSSPPTLFKRGGACCNLAEFRVPRVFTVWPVLTNESDQRRAPARAQTAGGGGSGGGCALGIIFTLGAPARAAVARRVRASPRQ